MHPFALGLQRADVWSEVVLLPVSLLAICTVSDCWRVYQCRWLLCQWWLWYHGCEHGELHYVSCYVPHLHSSWRYDDVQLILEMVLWMHT